MRAARLIAAALLLAPGAPAAAAAGAVQGEAQDPREAEFARLADQLNARQDAGDVAGAAAAIQRMVPLGAELLGGADPDYLDFLQRAGEYLAVNERRAEALDVMQRLHAGRRQALGPDDPKTVVALVYLATAHLQRGEFVQAAPLVERAAEAAEQTWGADSVDTLAAQNNLGVLRLEQGRDAEAEAILQRVLATRERVLGTDDEQTLETLVTLAVLYRRQARFGEAEPLAQRVLAAHEARSGADHPMTLYAANLLASLLTMQGDSDGAIAVYRRTRPAADRLGDHPFAIDAMDGLSAALLLKGEIEEALPLAERVVAARERVQGARHPYTLRALNGLASAYLNSSQPARAEPLLVRAMEGTRSELGEEHPDFLVAAENLTFARLVINPENPRAIDPARRLLAGVRGRRARSGPDSGPRPSGARDGWGRQNGRWYALFADAALAAGRAEPERHPELLGEVFLALQEAVAGEASASIARMAVRRYAERQGGDLGDLVRERETLTERWQALSESIAQSFAAAGEAEQARAGLRAEREQVETRLRAIDMRISAAFPDYFTLVRPGAVQGPEAQRLLREDEAVLIALPGPFGTHVMALSRDRAEWARSPLTAPQVEEAVGMLRYSAGAQVTATPEQIQEWERERPAGDAPWFDRTAAYGLYLATVAPVESVLRGKKRVYVIAGDALAALPFSLLVTAPPQGSDADPAALRATPWLAERYALIHVPSVQSLGLLRGARRSTAPDGFVGFGDPAFEGRATTRGARSAALPAAEEIVSARRGQSGALLANVEALRQLAQLPGTATELREMEALFGPQASRVFTRASATESQVYRTDLSNARVIVFATHGLTPSDPIGTAQASELFELAEPGLVLTPPMEASEGDDGFLSASEVTSLRLNADWVILSACNTASGDAATAGLSQLARAFFYAGARNLLASHWPVDDAVASRLTVRTLELERGGTPRAEAFQHAMREIRTDAAHAEWAHPFYWAPFVLIGDGG